MNTTFYAEFNSTGKCSTVELETSSHDHFSAQDPEATHLNASPSSTSSRRPKRRTSPSTKSSLNIQDGSISIIYFNKLR